ncbi:MAG: A/G-specific adenine glycosylase [Alphaproteobacteria bacterium]|nr:A/G-specific adenine glycosylase [Alphaproteobacteria bacterium]
MSRVKKIAGNGVAGLQDRLLGWFDRHQRVLPWRARKGRRPDPYHVWLSEIMLQQTTVVTVGPYFEKFLKKWPSVQKLAAASQDEVLAAWAGLGYYARARNLHKCAQAVTNDYGGVFPDTEEGLLELPGIGPYTAAAIASIAFDVPATAVDGNVERVVSRFFSIEEPLPASKKTIREKAAQLAKGVSRPGDFTQAFMELGATVCTPRKPKCGLCPWKDDCAARRKGNAEELPRKLAKAAKPVRYGKVFWLSDGKGRFLIHKRAGQGLYGGMYQLPTTEWITDRKAAAKLPAPFQETIKPCPLGESVRHSLTHFDLVLEIWTAKAPRAGTVKGLEEACWIHSENIGDYGLPTLMRKAIGLCAGL